MMRRLRRPANYESALPLGSPQRACSITNMTLTSYVGLPRPEHLTHNTLLLLVPIKQNRNFVHEKSGR
jgi:hypothetical protein